MSFKATPSQQFLRDALSYDPETGDFTWRERPHMGKRWNTRYANKKAGGVRGGRQPAFMISFDKNFFVAHRLAWVYEHGSIPSDITVDHINGNPLDNRLSNLRLATHAENCANKGWYRNNSSGYKGVHWHKRDRKWIAVIQCNKRQTQLGSFDSPEIAYEAYVRASKLLHGEFSRCV